MSRRSLVRSISAAGCLIAGVACRSDSTTGPSGRKQLEALSPIHMQAVVASTVNPVPTVRLVDANGQPIRGARIAFNVGWGGRVADTAVLTDQSGIATPGEWVLGNEVGENELVASGDSSVLPVHFIATAIADAPVRIVSGFTGEQVGVLNSSVTPPTVLVYDRFYNRVDGAKVTFAVSGGGALEPGNGVTHGGYTSAVSWTLGASAGVSTVLARMEGSDSVAIFTARAVDSALVSSWYTLESIDGVSPDKYAVSSATMALTPDGSFFEDVLSEDVLSQNQELLVRTHNSGAYSAQATTIVFSVVTRGSEQGRIDGDRLMIDRGFDDWGDTVTWSYKLVSGQSVQVQTGSK